MNLKEISFEPRAEVEFSACDVNLLMEWSRAHYDGVCKDVGKRGGFLYGLTFAGPDYRIRLKFREIDTLRKICEVGTIAGNPLSISMSHELLQIMKKMNDSSPDVVNP